MPDLRERITVDPAIRGGKPIIRGTRITVSDILECLAGGMEQSQLLADFPDLSVDDIRAALQRYPARFALSHKGSGARGGT